VLDNEDKMNFQEQDERAITASFLDVATMDIEISPTGFENPHNDQDSDLRSEEECDDLQFMDFEEQMKIYESM